MNRTKQPFLIVMILLIMVATLLAACGKSPTATPAATTKAAATTTVAATTAATTTAIATTAAVTTAAATTAVVTTAAPTTTIAATTTAAPTTAAPSSLQFKPFTAPDGSFVIMMPGTPKATQQPTNTAGQSLTNNAYLVELTSPEAGYVVSYVDYPANLKLDPASTLTGARDGQVGNGKLGNDKEIKLDTVPGREFDYIRDGGFWKSCIFYSNNRLYQLIVGYPEGKQNAADIQTFLNSFKITAAPATSSTPVANANTPGTTEIAVDPSITTAVAKSLTGVSDATVKMFVSDQTDADVSTSLDAFLVGSGYIFALPGETKPANLGDSYGAFYNKAGSPDVLLVVVQISDNPATTAKSIKDLALPGFDQVDLTKFQAQLKGHKSLVISVTGTGLGKVIYGGATTSTTPSATSAPAATTTPAVATTASAIADPTEITLDPAIKAALTKELASISDLGIKMYVSDDAPQHLATTIEDSFIQSGYKFNIPGATKVIRNGTGYVGAYSKDGVPEALFEVGTLSDDPAQLAKNFKDLDVPGTDQLDVVKFQAATKGHKSLVILLRGTGLSKAIYGSGSTSATPAATTVAASTNPLTEIAVDPTIQADLAKQLNGVSDLKVKMFVSDNAPEDIATTTDSGLLKTGYKFALPDHTEIYKRDGGHTYNGGYSKAGSPDLVLQVVILPDDITELDQHWTELNLPAMGPASEAKIQATIKGHKALVILISGTDLIKAAGH